MKTGLNSGTRQSINDNLALISTDVDVDLTICLSWMKPAKVIASCSERDMVSVIGDFWLTRNQVLYGLDYCKRLRFRFLFPISAISRFCAIFISRLPTKFIGVQDTYELKHNLVAKPECA